MTARDIRYGRQGGRVVPWDVPTDARPCDVCGAAVVTGGDRHHGCGAEPTDDQPSLFDDDDQADDQ